MSKQKKYTKKFRLMIVEEILRSDLQDNLYLIATKYNIRESTIERWLNNYLTYGERGLSQGFPGKAYDDALSFAEKERKAKDKEIADLKEEIEILKKAAAFLAKIDRN